MSNAVSALMFIPAKQKMLEKVPTLDADGFIFDLEDSIPILERECAADMLMAYLSEVAKDANKPWFVRIDRRFPIERVCNIARSAQVDGVMIPKMDMSDDSFALVDAVSHVCRKNVLALIETARGMLELESISKMDGISSLALGAEDLTCELGSDNCRDALAYCRSKIVICARAFGRTVYDTPTFETKDMEQMRIHTEDSRRYGFDGKLVIHPAQISIVRECFAIADPIHVQHIVSEYERLGGGIQVIDGRPYEAMHINRMRRHLIRQGGNR